MTSNNGITVKVGSNVEKATGYHGSSTSLISREICGNHNYVTLSIKRQCMVCGTAIVECMGFVLARDYLKNRIPPREICGKCIFVMEEEWPKVKAGVWNE